MLNIKQINQNLQKIDSKKILLTLLTTFLVILTITILITTNPLIKVGTVILWALYLFTTEKFPVDITAMLIMIVLIVSKLITPEQGVSGFSNPATITVLCMFILSAGIEKTGIIQKIGNTVFGIVGKSEVLQLLMLAIIIVPLSGFVNNTAAVAIFLPMILNLSKKSNTPATKLLIPLSFISMLGGTLTLLGTSTNILASSILEKNNLAGFSMFEFVHIGAIISIVGVLYFLFIGRFLLPSRKNSETKEEKLASIFLAELQIKKGSKFIGKTLNETKFSETFDIEIIKIIRGKQSFVSNMQNQNLEEEDILVIYGDEQRIIELDKRENEKLLLNFDSKLRRITTGTAKIVKVLVKGTHRIKNKTFEQIGFRRRYFASVIGMHRKNSEINTQRIADMKLKSGEVFLVKVAQSNLSILEQSNDLMLLEEIKHEYDPRKMGMAILIMTMVVLLPAFNLLPIMVSALIGVFFMFITKCLKADEIYRSVAWDVIFLLAGVIPLGIAIQESGAATWVATSIAGMSSFLSPLIILGLFYFVTTILTQILSNNAAVVLLMPIAISVAQNIEGLGVKTLALAVMFAASTCFLSPVGYQTNTMVYGAGNYKFSDFLKVGAPLNLILLFVTTFLIYYFFPA